MTLAERIDRTVRDWDPFSYADCDCSVEYFEELLKKSPETIIEGLLEQIDCLEEELEAWQ